MRVGLRRLGGLVASTALATGAGLVVLGGTAGAATFTVVNTADDGSNTSLRDVIENQATTDGDEVVLTAGATYNLSNSICSDLDTAADITIRSSSTTQNATIIQNCAGVDVIDAGDANLNLTVQNLNVTGGLSTEDGGAITVSEDLMLVRSRLFGNASSGDGGALNVEGDATIIASSIDGNCSEEDGGAMEIDGDMTIVNSTITQNTSHEDGAVDFDGEVMSLVYSDVVANIHEQNVDCGVPDEASLDDPGEVALPDPGDAEVEPEDTGEASNIEGGFNSFGSVVAIPLNNDPAPDPVNCEDTATSSGYNFSDDDTCEFTNVAAGDRENAGDRGLGELADNGGPTPTLLPADTSPLVNFIPLAACGGGDALAGFAVTTDQRGITRPQETGCEIGSVELEAVELVVQFTG